MQAANQRCLEGCKVLAQVPEEASRFSQRQLHQYRMILIKFIKSD
jgi:hypothetical protein